MAAFGQIAIERNALVENEALALPAIVRLPHALEIAQHPAIEMIDLIEPQFEHQGRGFLAANAAGAEHRERTFGMFPRQRPGKIRKLAKAMGARIERAGEAADFDFVAVARIDDDERRIVEQGIPFGRRNVSSRPPVRLDVGPAQGDDFPFYLDPQTPERGRGGVGPARLEPGFKTQPPLDEAQHAFDTALVAGHRGVDAFVGDEHRAKQPGRAAFAVQRTSERPGIRKIEKPVKGRDSHAVAARAAASMAAQSSENPVPKTQDQSVPAASSSAASRRSLRSSSKSSTASASANDST